MRHYSPSNIMSHGLLSLLIMILCSWQINKVSYIWTGFLFHLQKYDITSNQHHVKSSDLVYHQGIKLLDSLLLSLQILMITLLTNKFNISYSWWNFLIHLRKYDITFQTTSCQIFWIRLLSRNKRISFFQGFCLF